ncbi:MAG: hypothetical protein ACK6AT_17805, partial [Planctomycetota bacterium]
TTLREYLHQVSLAYNRTVVDLAKDPSACNHGKYSDNLQKGTLVHNRHTSNVNSYVDQVVRVSRFAQAQGSLARTTTLREYLHQVSLAYDRTVVDLAKDPCD